MNHVIARRQSQRATALHYILFVFLAIASSAWAVTAPEPVVTGNQLNWPAVSARTINVHRGDGSYVESIPGDATSWNAPEPGDYFLVAANSEHWSNWPRSETVTVETTSTEPGSTVPMPIVDGDRLSWPIVSATTINVHRGDGSYIESLPGNATSWIAPEEGEYFLVAANGEHWSTWQRSAVVTVGSTSTEPTSTVPMPVVDGYTLSWPMVSATSINVHRGDGSYVESLPGSATSWTAPAEGTYFLVAANGGHWSTWERSERVTVGSGDITTTTLSVSLNPYGIAPLAAEVEFTASEPVKVSVSIAGPEPLAYDLNEFSTTHKTPVIGLYAGTSNAVTLTLQDRQGARVTRELTITTPVAPFYFPEVVVDEYNALSADGLVFVDFAWGRGTYFSSKPIAFDKNGDVRWWFDMEALGRIAIPMQFTVRNTFIIGAYDSIREYAMTGQLIREVFFPGYLEHHDVIEKPNGNLLVAVDNESASTVEDHIIEITWSGDIVNVWDLRNILDVDRTDLEENLRDWFHMNSIWFDASDNSLIVSGRNQGVIKLTENNELAWILAPHEGWGKAGPDGNGFETSDFLLTAVDAGGTAYAPEVQSGFEKNLEFDWPWGQHTAMLQGDGNVFLFDNGFHRRFGLPTNDFSRAVEYRIDETNMTVQEIWQYGRERTTELYSPIVSDVDILPNTNRLMTSGISFGEIPPRARISEVTYPEKIVAFEMSLYFRNAESGGSFAWGDFDLVYRAEKWVPFSN